MLHTKMVYQPTEYRCSVTIRVPVLTWPKVDHLMLIKTEMLPTTK